MTSIQGKLAASGIIPRQNALQDSAFSSYVQKQSVSAYERLEAGLTIKTREGDVVTLNSSAYSRMDSSLYNSKGMVQTQSGMAGVSEQVHSILLATGETFSFSVEGALSDSELNDIVAIVKGIDDIVSDVTEGNLTDAMTRAASMGGYETIDMYAADIFYQKSTRLTSATQAEAGALSRANDISQVNDWMEKMAEKLEKHDGKMIEKSRKPVEKLFEHYLETARDAKNRFQTPQYTAIETVMEKLLKMMDEMTADLFENDLSAAVNT